MKKFLLKTTLFLIFILCIISAWMYIGFVVEPVNSYSYLAAHRQKIHRLDTLSSPRLILVGGSNTAFGFNSRRIADSLGMNVQNMGTHASMGLRYVLDQTSRYLRKGDRIIILPEYEQFFFEYNGSGDILTQAFLYSDPGSWRDLNFTQAVNVIDGFPSVETGRWKSSPVAPVVTRWNYDARNFNKYGDEQAHWHADSAKEQIELTKLDLHPDRYTISDFTSKVKSLRRAGYDVIILWPSTTKSNYRLNRQAMGNVEMELASRGIHFNSHPGMFLHEDSIMLDSEYHVLYSGVESNTDSLIRFLKQRDVKN